ncbi:MAG: DUF169 domain-containing protein [Eggerthellaceae bacterium]|nr:DUF169 domain-containing protein [Eggerthellaceae bacterium]
MLLDQKAKDTFAKLELEFSPVCLKYMFLPPEGVERYDGVGAFCKLVNAASKADKPFYIDKENEECFGKVALGMVPDNPGGAAGNVGPDIDMYATPAPNSRLHEQMTMLSPGCHNYVLMAPMALCDFDPDIIMIVAPTDKAEIILRATSFVSGDLWESKSSPVMSCSWMYAYPYASGKVNFCITGMHHGLKRRNLYPAGMHMIAIPFQKLPETIYALENMNWVPLYFRQDTEEGRAELSAKQAKWAKDNGNRLGD